MCWCGVSDTNIHHRDTVWCVGYRHPSQEYTEYFLVQNILHKNIQKLIHVNRFKQCKLEEEKGRRGFFNFKIEHCKFENMMTYPSEKRIRIRRDGWR